MSTSDSEIRNDNLPKFIVPDSMFNPTYFGVRNQYLNISGGYLYGPLTGTSAWFNTMTIGTVVIGNVVVGHLTATSIFAGDLTATNAFMSSLTAGVFFANTGVIAHSLITQLTATNVDISSLTATTGNVSNLSVVSLTATSIYTVDITATNEVVSSLTATTGHITQLTATSIYSVDITATNVNITTLTATNEVVSSLTATNVNITQLTASNISVLSITATTASLTNINISNITATNVNIATLTATNAFAENLRWNNATGNTLWCNTTTIMNITNSVLYSETASIIQALSIGTTGFTGGASGTALYIERDAQIGLGDYGQILIASQFDPLKRMSIGLDVVSDQAWIQANIALGGTISLNLNPLGGHVIANLLTGTDGWIQNLHTNSLFIGDNVTGPEGTITTLYTQSLFIGDNVTGPEGTITTLYTQSLFVGDNMIAPQGTITALTATSIYVGSITGTNAYFTNLTIGSMTATTHTIANLTWNTATGNTLWCNTNTLVNINSSTATITNLNNSNLYGSSGSFTSLTATTLTGSTATITNINNSNLYGSSGSFESLTATTLTSTNATIQSAIVPINLHLSYGGGAVTGTEYDNHALTDYSSFTTGKMIMYGGTDNNALTSYLQSAVIGTSTARMDLNYRGGDVYINQKRPILQGDSFTSTIATITNLNNTNLYGSAGSFATLTATSVINANLIQATPLTGICATVKYNALTGMTAGITGSLSDLRGLSIFNDYAYGFPEGLYNSSQLNFVYETYGDANPAGIKAHGIVQAYKSRDSNFNYSSMNFKIRDDDGFGGDLQLIDALTLQTYPYKGVVANIPFSGSTATISNLTVSAGSFTSLTSTTSTITNLNNMNLYGSSGSFASLTATTLTGSTATITNLNNMNLYGSSGSFASLTATTLTGSTATITNLNNTNLYGSSASFVGITSTTLTGITATIENINNTNLYGTTGIFASIVSTTGVVANLRNSRLWSTTGSFTGSLSIGTNSFTGDSGGASLYIERDDAIAFQDNGQIRIAGASDPGKRLSIGMDTTSNQGWIQANYAGVGLQQLNLNPLGGVVVAPLFSSTSATIANLSATNMTLTNHYISNTTATNAYSTNLRWITATGTTLNCPTIQNLGANLALNANNVLPSNSIQLATDKILGFRQDGNNSFGYWIGYANNNNLDTTINVSGDPSTKRGISFSTSSNDSATGTLSVGLRMVPLNKLLGFGTDGSYIREDTTGSMILSANTSADIYVGGGQRFHSDATDTYLYHPTIARINVGSSDMIHCASADTYLYNPSLVRLNLAGTDLVYGNSTETYMYSATQLRNTVGGSEMKLTTSLLSLTATNGVQANRFGVGVAPNASYELLVKSSDAITSYFYNDTTYCRVQMDGAVGTGNDIILSTNGRSDFGIINLDHDFMVAENDDTSKARFRSNTGTTQVVHPTQVILNAPTISLVGSLTGANAFISNLTATNLAITNLTSTNAFISNLTCTNADITTLTATTTTITTIRNRGRYFGLSEDTAWTWDADGYARTGFVKKTGDATYLCSANGTDLLFGYSSATDLQGTNVSSQTITKLCKMNYQFAQFTVPVQSIYTNATQTGLSSYFMSAYQLNYATYDNTQYFNATGDTILLANAGGLILPFNQYMRISLTGTSLFLNGLTPGTFGKRYLRPNSSVIGNYVAPYGALDVSTPMEYACRITNGKMYANSVTCSIIVCDSVMKWDAGNTWWYIEMWVYNPTISFVASPETEILWDFDVEILGASPFRPR